MILVTVQGSMSLDAPAADAWFALEAAGLFRFGWNANITAPGGAFRSPETVLDMWLSSPQQRHDVYGVPLGGSVAKPKSLGGAGSAHENGRCVDIGNWASILPGDQVGADLRLQRLAAEFGFRRTIKGERWHYQFFGGGGSGGTPAPAVPTIRRNRMFIIDMTKSETARNGYWIVAPGYLHGFSAVEWNDWGAYLQTAGVWVFTPTDAGFDSIVSLFTGQRSYGSRGVDEFSLLSALRTGGAPAAAIDYDLLAQKTAALVKFPTTLTIDPPPATGQLS